MKLYALPENTINNTLTYLAAKPFVEVTDLIAALQKAKLVVNSDGTALEIPDAPLVLAPEAPTAALEASLPETTPTPVEAQENQTATA